MKKLILIILLTFCFCDINEINYRIQLYSFGQHIETYFTSELPELEYYFKFKDILKDNKKYICMKGNNLIIVTLMFTNSLTNK